MKRFLAFLLPALIGTSVYAQPIDLDEALQALMDNAMQLNITARVLPQHESPAWNVQSTKLTVPGRSVSVKMMGQDLQIDLILTPYLEEDGKLLLLAQGQVWYSGVPENQVRYLSTLKSIPLSWGEKILFYPLGLSEPPTDQQAFNLQLEIQVLPYKGKEEAVAD